MGSQGQKALCHKTELCGLSWMPDGRFLPLLPKMLVSSLRVQALGVVLFSGYTEVCCSQDLHTQQSSFFFLTCCAKVLQNNSFAALCWVSSQSACLVLSKGLSVSAFLLFSAERLTFVFFLGCRGNVSLQRHTVELNFQGWHLAGCIWAHRFWGVWFHTIGNRAPALGSGLSLWDKVVLAVPPSPSFGCRRPYDNHRRCRGCGSFVCSSNERWESAGLGVNTSFSQQSQVCLKLPLGGIFPFPPCLLTSYRASGAAVAKLRCKALEGRNPLFG